MKPIDEAIEEITEKLRAIDDLPLERLSEEQHEIVSRIYAAGVLLRAQFQARKTLGSAK